MNNRIITTALAAAALLLCAAPPSKAGDITDTIGLFDEPADFSGNYPSSLENLGTFTFSLPMGFNIGSVTISGTFGNEDIPGFTNLTADSDYYVDGTDVEVATCDSPDIAGNGPTLACDAGSSDASPTPWTYTLTTAQVMTIEPALETGSLDFNVIQNYYGAVETGPVTLDIAPTPEPATISIVSLGLAGIALLRRRKL